MLSQKKCVPCQGGIDPLNPKQVSKLISKLEDGWGTLENIKIKKEYIFNLYSQAISFANKVANLAESENHHPYIHINFKKVEIIIFTHKINGLHENDFILASKCDLLFKE